MPPLFVHHVQLAMPAGGESRAAEFYAGILGMTPIEKPEAMRSSGGVWFRSGTAELHLGVEPQFRPARKAHPALAVRDIDELATRCADAGLEVVWDDRFPGARRFFVSDPFGNRVELLEPIDGRPKGPGGELTG